MNQDIVNYLKEGIRRGFSIQLLKKKLLEGGFKEKDVDEAIAIVEQSSTFNDREKKIDLFSSTPPTNLQQTSAQATEQAGQASFGMKDSTHQTFKTEKSDLFREKDNIPWIKIAGIVGVVLLLIGISLSVADFVDRETLIALISNGLVFLVISIMVAILVFFYYFGFVNVGKHAGEKMLSVGAWLIIAPIFAYIILGIISNIYIYPQTSNLLAADLNSVKVLFLSVSIAWVVFLLLHSVAHLIFSVGLIKTSGRIKFAKITGILNIIVFVLGLFFIIGMIVLTYSVLNALSAGGADVDVFTNSPGAGLATYSFIGIYILKLIALLFEVLVLFSSSKKFEE